MLIENIEVYILGLFKIIIFNKGEKTFEICKKTLTKWKNFMAVGKYFKNQNISERFACLNNFLQPREVY